MTKFLGFLLGLAVIIGVVGWAAGWWRIRTERTGDEGAMHVEVDGGEIGRDLRDARDAIGGTVQGAKSSASASLQDARGEVQLLDTAGISIALANAVVQRFEYADGLEVVADEMESLADKPEQDTNDME